MTGMEIVATGIGLAISGASWGVCLETHKTVKSLQEVRMGQIEVLSPVGEAQVGDLPLARRGGSLSVEKQSAF